LAKALALSIRLILEMGLSLYGIFLELDSMKKLADRDRNVETYTNQLAAMPSLHFGYSLIIGMTLAKLPLDYHKLNGASPANPSRQSIDLVVRGLCRLVGVLYPLTILVVIVATANHFVFDAVVGGSICLVACRYNRVMLNLRLLEDCVLFILRISKPKPGDDWYACDDLEAS
jgi:hypothetical protein